MSSFIRAAVFIVSPHSDRTDEDTWDHWYVPLLIKNPGTFREPTVSMLCRDKRKRTRRRAPWEERVFTGGGIQTTGDEMGAEGAHSQVSFSMHRAK